MLNAVFGIMIDSFGELRTARKEIKIKNESECFICGIDRLRLDTKGGGFQKHIQKDHNMWNYLFLIMTILDKDETEYNGWEQHVAEKLRAKDTSFLPKDALSLQSVKRSELAEEQAERAQAAQTAARVAELTITMNTMQRNAEEQAAKAEERAAQAEERANHAEHRADVIVAAITALEQSFGQSLGQSESLDPSSATRG